METLGDRIQSASSTGAAWLSSARAVRCRLKWFNERNPRFLLLISIFRRDALLQFGWIGDRCCMAVVSSCREMLG